MIYALLMLLWFAIWFPLARRRMRWEMFIYGQSIVIRHRPLTAAEIEERTWSLLSNEWHTRDVQ